MMVNRNNHALDANDNDNVTITGDLIILAEEEEDLDEEEEFGNTAWQHDLFILSYFRILFYFFVPLKDLIPILLGILIGCYAWYLIYLLMSDNK